MNFRIILHFLKTDWLRLRGLIVAFWILAILAAWPGLAFSPEHFSNPLSIQTGWYDDHSIRSALTAQGEISPAAEWAFLTAKWMLTFVSLSLAGAFGFHTRSWTEARPLRKWDLILARGVELVIFLMIPLVAVAPATSLIHGFGIAAAWHAFLFSTALMAPTLVAACLFGALCGGWSRWIAGAFVFQLASSLLPVFLGMGRISLPAMFLQPWINVAVLAAVLAWTSHHMKAWHRICIAVGAAFLAPYLIPRPTILSWDVSENLPDWSSTVEPMLTNPELVGNVTTQLPEGFMTSGPESNQARLQFEFLWETKGLPPGVFAMWKPSGHGDIISGDETVSSRVSGLRTAMRSDGAGPAGFDKNALTAAVAKDDSPVKWKAFYSGFLAEKSKTTDLFDTVELSSVKKARLETELSGNAYRIVKLLDVPFGQHAEATVEGVRVHVRRLDIVDSWPVADLCYVVSTSGFDTVRGMPGLDWIPVLHFPDTGEYRLLDYAETNQAELATGCVAIRRMYWACERIHGQKPDMKEFGNARFLLLKRENLAILKKQFRSESLPLVISDETHPPDAREFREPPPFQLRPDPATTSDQEFSRWLTRSYSVFDSQGWPSRDMADFVPRHLEMILQRRGGVQPPSSPEGRAIALACPEARRDEVIGTLSRRNVYPEVNWIPDVILRRGWVQAAAPQIREMAARGQVGDNPYSQVMVMALEDPETYHAILGQRLWFEAYEQARRLPGVEPALTESLVKRYEEDSGDRKQEYDARRKMNDYLPAAAHGLPKAFSALLRAWQTADEGDRHVYADYFSQVILVPGSAKDWKLLVSALDGKEAGDFRYDSLAHIWIPISANPR